MAERLIGIDLGGTSIKAVLLDTNGKILEQRSRDTSHQLEDPDHPDHWKTGIRTMVTEILEATGETELPIGLSAPGLPSEDHSRIAYMPGRFAGLEGLDWAWYLHTGKVYVTNDAQAALMAESYFGAGKGINNIVMLTLGTGVGGALLLDGKLYTGRLNRAGHLGHITLDTSGESGILNLPGTLEMAIGNATIRKRTKGRYNSTDELLKDHRKGVRPATEVWLESVKKLAIGLSSIINVISPDLVILGGGIAGAGKDLFEPLGKFMDDYEWRPGDEATPITRAVFENYAGAVGAACFAIYKLKQFKTQTQ